MPDSKTADGISQPSSRLLEEALAIHNQFGDQYMDENPITGKPGDFHLSSTGRKAAVNLSAAAAANLKKAALLPSLPALNTKLAAENPLAAGAAGGAKAGKETKSPKTPGGGGGGGIKGKKRKSSKAAVTPS